MAFFMKILDRYIAKSIYSTVLLMSVIVLAVQSFLQLLQEMGGVGKNGFTMADAFLFAAMQLPIQFYTLFPIVAFLSVLIALSRLSLTSELTVIRASGVSVFRLAKSVMKASIVVVAAVTLLCEMVGPQLSYFADSRERSILEGIDNNALLHSIWLHQKNTFTHIESLVGTDKIVGITRYHFDHDNQMVRAIQASQGRLEKPYWELENLRESIFSPTEVTTIAQPNDQLHLDFQPKLEVMMEDDVRERSLSGLSNTIHYLKNSGLNSSGYQFAFWQRVFQPIATLVLICLAIPFVFGSFRDAKMGQQIVLGTCLGFIFYMLNQLLGPITLVYQVPAFLSACTPTLLFLLLALVLLARV